MKLIKISVQKFLNEYIQKNLSISEEIKQSDKPVVALESTIITHGLPYPLNLETALQVENVVRELNV